MSRRVGAEFAQAITVAKKIFQQDHSEVADNDGNLVGILVIRGRDRSNSLALVGGKRAISAGKDLVGYSKSIVRSSFPEESLPPMSQYSYLSPEEYNQFDSRLEAQIEEAARVEVVGYAQSFLRLADPQYRGTLDRIVKWYEDSNIQNMSKQLEGVTLDDYKKWSEQFPGRDKDNGFKNIGARAWNSLNIDHVNSEFGGKQYRALRLWVMGEVGPHPMAVEQWAIDVADGKNEQHSSTEALDFAVRNLKASGVLESPYYKFGPSLHQDGLYPDSLLDRLASPLDVRPDVMAVRMGRDGLISPATSLAIAVSEAARLSFIRKVNQGW